MTVVSEQCPCRHSLGGRRFELRLLQNEVLVPENAVVVVVFGGIEPEVDPLLSVALSLREYIGLENVRLTGHVAQKFEIQLTPVFEDGSKLRNDR